MGRNDENVIRAPVHIRAAVGHADLANAMFTVRTRTSGSPSRIFIEP
jgi:hypothetical protein